MNNQHLENHKLIASSMEWEDLADAIIDMEMDTDYLKECLTKKEISKFKKILKIGLSIA